MYIYFCLALVSVILDPCSSSGRTIHRTLPASSSLAHCFVPFFCPFLRSERKKRPRLHVLDCLRTVLPEFRA